ncbi:helix-turn-helix domain-containing protein [Cohnella sp. GCM10027633]|uniref:helix-turn-helix domain-containing protein n=1 Tax=unclassified Cohnella TaxID=2636738 RepID=UPI00362FB9AF
MGTKNEYSGLEKLEAIRGFEDGRSTQREIAQKYNVNISTLEKWRRKYDQYGIQGLETRTRNNSYSAKLKVEAVQDYLTGKYSHNQIIKKYKIASTTQLIDWIRKYNGHSNLSSYYKEL